jgi:hypothetical protein
MTDGTIVAITRDEIMVVVNENLGNGESFSAFDVTDELRGRNVINGENKEILHSNVRQVIRDEFTNGNTFYSADYDRTLVTLNVPNEPETLIYHPDNVDAWDYRLAKKDTVTVDDDDDSSFSKTKEGRLSIPKGFLNKIGVAAGDDIYLLPITDGMELSPYKVLNDQTTMIVNADGRVRLSTTRLNCYDLNGDKFKIELSQPRMGTIEIKKA